MMEEKSHLCKSLSEILNDKTQLSMLPYFIQYMEEAKAIHLVQFWFSVEAFRTATTALMSKPDVLSTGYYNNSCSSNNSNGEGCCSCDPGHKPVAMTPSLSRKLLHVNDNMEDIPRGKVIHSKYHWETSSFMAQKSLCVKSDAIDIYTAYISLNAINNVNISDSLRRHIEVTISPEDGVVKKDCFDEAQTVVFSEMETRYHPQFCRSRFLSKYQLEYISAGHLVMTDILLNNNALFYFMEFMEGQGASVLLRFWSTVENYKAHFKSEGVTVNSEHAFNDAMIIYNRYLSLLAGDRIDVEDVVRISVENKICGEEGVSLDAFNVPQYLIYDRMNEVYYPLFLQSDQYRKYISELMYMMEPARPDHHHIATTQHFINTQQQAIASGNSCKQQVLDELDDPSELWRRPHSMLRFGYVTKYGQFVSEAEPDPCHKSHQGYKRRSLSTILGRDDHSLAKLEMAREQAEKIIQQILTLTKPPSTHVT